MSSPINVVESDVTFTEGRVHVREVGEGPPLLLINGLSAHTAMWGPLEHSLEGFRLVEFDLPGAGASDIPWRPVSIPRLARLAAAVLDHAGIGQADVLGYSMGGMVAQQLAVDLPARVRRLVLLATSPGVGAVQGDLKAVLNIMTPLRYFSPKAYEKTVGSLVGGRARRDPHFVAEQGTLRRQHAPSWRGYTGQLASMARWSGLPLLSQISQPTLVVAGDDDPLTPLANGMMITHLLPEGRMVICNDEGHLMPLDPDSAAHPMIREFLTATDLSVAPVWARAERVSSAQLTDALQGTGPQLPPWSIANARMRKRWLQGRAVAGSTS